MRGHTYRRPGRHEHGASGNERRVFWAMLLTASFMVAEVVGGLLSGSLALLADAGHMLTGRRYVWPRIQRSSGGTGRGTMTTSHRIRMALKLAQMNRCS